MRKLFDFLLRLFPAEYQHAWRLYNKMPIQGIATIEIRECTFKDNVYFVIPKGVDNVYIFCLDCILPNAVRLYDSRVMTTPSCIININEIPIYLNDKGRNGAHGYFEGLAHYISLAVKNKEQFFYYQSHRFDVNNAQALVDYAKARGLMTH